MTQDPGSRAGSTFGPYELIDLVGRGGMGEVYRARDTHKDRIVAIKLLPRAFSDDPRFRQRFEREAHVAAGLNDPHVVPIHDYGEIDGVLYIDMAFVEGSDLRSLLQRHGPMPADGAVDLISAVASALDASHARGLLHRDVKPENILVTGKGFVYLTDFGIAAQQDETRLTTRGGAIGSMAYMAPERFDDAEVDGAVDQYALGCVLFECLTGRPPFQGASTTAMMKAQLFSPAPQLDPSGAATPLDMVIHRALSKDPHSRFPDVTAMAAAAREALRGQVDPETRRLFSAGAATTAGPAASPWAGVTTMNTPTMGGPAGAPAASQGGASPATGGKSPTNTLWKVAIAAAAVAVIAIAAVLMGNLLGDDQKEAGASAGSESRATQNQAPQSSSTGPESTSAEQSENSPSSESAAPSSESSSDVPATTAPAIAQKTPLSSLTAQPNEPTEDAEETIAGKSYSSVIELGSCGSGGGETYRWALDGKYASFTAAVGQVDSGSDDDTLSVDFVVDGKVVAQSDQLKIGTAAKTVSFDVKGANLLTITSRSSTCNSNHVGLGDPTLTAANN